MHTTTGASAASQSTAGTAATNTTNGTPATTGGGGTGSWGRVARTVDWVRGAGVHPPFAFESAASSTASANGDRRGGSGGNGSGSGSDIRERERDRDRERSRRHVAHPQAPPAVPASPRKSARGGGTTSAGTGTGTGPGRWEQREVELGLGLTWAPSKIRVREWTPSRTGVRAGASADNNDARAQALMRDREMEKRVREREGARRTRERLAEYELGYARERSGKDKEVTGRFREVLGGEAFEAFKKCKFYCVFFRDRVLLRFCVVQTYAGSTRKLFHLRDRRGYLGTWNVCWTRRPRATSVRLRNASC
jgi:hypothetical protein